MPQRAFNPLTRRIFPMSDVGHHAQTKALQTIDDCMETYKVCRQTAAYSVNEGGTLAEPHRIQILYDAAEINLAMADFLSRASPFHNALGRLCIEITRACAEAISQDEHDDDQLRITYAACERSVRACKELTGTGEDAHSDERDVALEGTFPASDPTPPPTEL